MSSHEASEAGACRAIASMRPWPGPAGSGNASRRSGRRWRQRRSGAALGLSAKLLLLTITFVMLAEVLIFVPSVANFRITWLTDRLTAAQLAALAAEAVPGGVGARRSCAPSCCARPRCAPSRSSAATSAAWCCRPTTASQIDDTFDFRASARDARASATSLHCACG